MLPKLPSIIISIYYVSCIIAPHSDDMSCLSLQIRPAPNPPSNEMAPAVPPRPPITKKDKDLPPTPPPKTPLKPPVQGHGGGHSHEKTGGAGGHHQKREKKPKMSDAEVLAHLSKFIIIVIIIIFHLSFLQD